jgi:hypothetical protein
VSAPPANPKIYHITHLDNVISLIEHNCLWSDAKRLQQDISNMAIGMSEIKRRRLEELEVTCHQGTKVGEYVPFYFCPRSIMLYLLYRGNAPGLTYTGGQEPIIHLEADLFKTLRWAEQNGRRWAFSTSNAGARYVNFYNHMSDLNKVDWQAVSARIFTDTDTKEGKQAEFLLYESFPWHLFQMIGVNSSSMATKVEQIISNATHKPIIQVKNDWYFKSTRTI